MHMPELAVVVVGTVFQYLPQKDFETKEPQGAKVGILADGAATEVKFSQEEVQTGFAPGVGDHVALFVRPRPWKMNNGNSGVSFTHVRPVEPGDLDQLAAIVVAAPASK